MFWPLNGESYRGLWTPQNALDSKETFRKQWARLKNSIFNADTQSEKFKEWSALAMYLRTNSMDN